MWVPISVILVTHFAFFWFFLRPYFDFKTTVSIVKGKPCPGCRQKDHPIELTSEHYLRDEVVSTNTTRHKKSMDCPNCGGEGTYEDSYDLKQVPFFRRCGTCKGTGRLFESEQVEIHNTYQDIYEFHYQCSKCHKEWHDESNSPQFLSRTKKTVYKATIIDKIRAYWITFFCLTPAAMTLYYVVFDPAFFGKGFAGLIFMIMGFVIIWLGWIFFWGIFFGVGFFLIRVFGPIVLFFMRLFRA